MCWSKIKHTEVYRINFHTITQYINNTTLISLCKLTIVISITALFITVMFHKPFYNQVFKSIFFNIGKFHFYYSFLYLLYCNSYFNFLPFYILWGKAVVLNLYFSRRQANFFFIQHRVNSLSFGIVLLFFWKKGMAKIPLSINLSCKKNINIIF